MRLAYVPMAFLFAVYDGEKKGRFKSEKLFGSILRRFEKSCRNFVPKLHEFRWFISNMLGHMTMLWRDFFCFKTATQFRKKIMYVLVPKKDESICNSRGCSGIR